MFARWLWYLAPANPIVVRIVQGSSQRMRDFWVRVGYLGALIMLVLIGLLGGEGMGSNATITDLAKAGTKVFNLVAQGQVILVCLIAPMFMAGAINQERQGETFDILLTTPLSNLQIVLGSLLSRLYFILALLLSGLPLFSVLLIFGGVPIRAVFVAFIVSALAALLVGSVAVTISVLRTGGRKAVFVFIVSIAAYLVGSYAIDFMLRASAATPGQTTWLTPLNPLLVLLSSFDPNYRPPSSSEAGGLSGYYMTNPLGAFTLITLLISGVLMLFSATLVRRLGQGEALIPLPASWRRVLRLTPAGERTRPPRTVWQNPIAWKESKARGKVAAGILARWGFLVIGIVAAIVLVVMFHGDKLPHVAGPLGGVAVDQGPAFRMILLAMLWLEIAIIVMVAIYMSAGSVSKEREDGTLDLLLTTPITPKYYVWGKLRGLVQFLATLIAVPVSTLAIACIYAVAADARVRYQVGTKVFPSEPLLNIEAMLLLPMLLVPFVALCVTIGLVWSIKSKGVMGAVIPTVAIVGMIALLLSFCGLNASQEIAVVGPILNAFSPVTNLLMIVNPWNNVDGYETATAGARANLFMAALIAAAGYSMIVYIYLTASVKNFDQTVRKLSGAA